MPITYDEIDREEPEPVAEEREEKKARGKEEILDEAKKRYQMCLDAMTDNLNDARNDLIFLKGGTNQWDSDTVIFREQYKLPMITVNTLPAFLHQVTNDQRMNTPMIKVHPVDDNADIETAKVIQGLIRHIEYDSNADVAEDTAVNCAAAIGFGYFQLITDYEYPDSFDQCIKYKRIRNPLSVKIDPLSSEADGSDMKYCFIESLMDKKEFQREYPKADCTENSVFSSTSGESVTAWITQDSVMVCEYYAIEYDKDELIELSNGEKGYKSKLLEMPEGITIVRQRETFRPRVTWRKITACDILEETEIKCDWIPVFPVYGDEIDVDGKVTRSGIIRNAKGPAQMYNAFLTSATEEVLLRSKSPYMMAEGQEEGHEAEFAMANRAPLAFVTYKPTTVEGILVPPPQRNPTADIPTGMISLAMQAKENIMATTGLFQASLGQRGTATSGIQERAQQKEGDMANFHYMDGLLRTLRHTGRCLVSMIPHYYNTARTVRVLGEDDSAEHVAINQPTVEQEEQNGQMTAIEKVMHDMTIGKYDVTVASGPSFTTMRQESAQFFADAMSSAKDPATASVISYLAIKSQDIPNAELAAKLIQATLPPPMQKIIEDETGGKQGEEQEPMIETPQGPVSPQQVPQLLEGMAAQIQDLQMQLEKSGAQENEAKMGELQVKGQEVQVKQFDAETKREQAMSQQQIDQQRLQIEMENAQTERMRVDNERMQIELEAQRIQFDAEKHAIDTMAADNERASAENNRVNGEEKTESEMPKKMTITAPSGAAYEVTLQ